MADDLLDLDLDTPSEEQEKINKTEKRIKDLSEKVKLTATERDELKAAKELAETEKAAALKDAEFFKNFNTVASRHQGATEYQDKIREKVLAGYDLEDATISILAKEGKYTPPAPTPLPKESPAGGSAPTTLKSGEKTIGDMTQDERRSLLLEAEKRGDIGLS